MASLAEVNPNDPQQIFRDREYVPQWLKELEEVPKTSREIVDTLSQHETPLLLMVAADRKPFVESVVRTLSDGMTREPDGEIGPYLRHLVAANQAAVNQETNIQRVWSRLSFGQDLASKMRKSESAGVQKMGTEMLLDHVKYSWELALQRPEIFSEKDLNNIIFMMHMCGSLEDIWSNGDDQDFDKSLDYIKSLVAREQKPSVARVMADLWVSAGIREKDKSFRVRLNAATRELLPDFGFDFDKVSRYWSENQPGSRFLGLNATAFWQLEKNDPGICRALYDKYGIIDFGRYSKAALREQFKQTDTGQKYGMVFVTRSDHSGANYQGYWHSKIIKTFEGLGYRICVGEYATVRELVHLCNQFSLSPEDRKSRRKDKTKDRRKASFGIILSHGKKARMYISDKEGVRDKGRKLYPQFLRRSGTKAFGNAFEDGSPFIIISCNAGVDHKVAQTASRFIPNLLIVATPEHCAEAVITPGNEAINVKLFDVNARPVETRIFAAGKKHPNREWLDLPKIRNAAN